MWPPIRWPALRPDRLTSSKLFADLRPGTDSKQRELGNIEDVTFQPWERWLALTKFYIQFVKYSMRLRKRSTS